MIRVRPTAVRTGIHGIGLASPRAVDQSAIARLAEERCCESDGQRAWLRRVFARSSIARRNSVLQTDHAGLEDFYTDDQPTTAERMRRFAREAPALAERACGAVLKNLTVSPQEITHLITVSCTGFFAPGLDFELVDSLALRRNIQRMQIGFMGCHAALNALSAARAIVCGDPGAIVLVCCVELCSLHFNYQFEPSRIVASALFGDGAAAMIVRDGALEGHDSTWRMLHSESLMVPGTRDEMSWIIGDHGFEMNLSPRVPERVEESLRDWCTRWLAEQNVSLDEISLWAIHPGGPRVLEAAERSLQLPPTALRWSREVLRDCGNLSSVTLPYILANMATDKVRGKCVALGFGPGLVLEGLLLER